MGRALQLGECSLGAHLSLNGSDLTSGWTGFWIKYIVLSVCVLSSLNDWQDDIVDAFVIYWLYDYLQ